MADRPTLLKPPQWDPSKAPIENVLDVTELAVLGPNIFTNTRQPWHPPGARGVYGGAVIAMCVAAGQRTVPDDFTVHSCHCYFILAGSADIPIMFHVEKVRDGRSFMTRTVQARQRGRAIFTTTMSFVREEAPAAQVRHALPMPVDEDGAPLWPPADDWQADESISTGPYESGGITVVNRESADAHAKKTRQWIRARGTIRGGHQAHLNALAYISDSYFIGTISRIHRLWRFPFKVEEIDALPAETRDHIRRLNDFEGGGMDLKSFGDRPHIGMMVSLDHTIYFHEPRRVKADDWMLAEMESPWAGDGRGVVTQRIFAKDGTLLATCVQEGLCRLKETPQKEGGEKASKL